MRAAFAVAALADGLQLLTGPLGWTGGDQIIDLGAMILTTWLLGFHLFLLPTFVVELIPVVDLFPTWLGCVFLVVKRQNDRRNQPTPPPDPPTTPS